MVADPIYIFYALISEEKSNGLKIHGPFIHSKPHCDDESAYIFDKSEYKEERKFLSKFLREKHQNRLSIFHYISLSSASKISVSCDCGFKTHLPEDYVKNNWLCPSCGNDNVIENFAELKIRARRMSMLDAQEYFEKKFEQMEENFAICNRIRKKK